MIRLQDKTPEVYCAESRDFQLFCRLYDCVTNSVKFNVDTIPDILDATKCRTEMLALLQTKLGFFTNKQLTDDALRYVLASFPIMVRNKGSLKAIQQAVNVFFKVYGIRSEVKIWSTNERIKIYDTWVDDHTIIIGINSTIKDVSLLEEIFRYILPAGFGYYFYFYNEIAQTDPYIHQDNATLLFVSDNINSNLRSGNDIVEEDNSIENRLLNAVDSITINSSDSITDTINGTYTSRDESKFLGVLNALPDRGVEGQCVLVNNIQYLYTDHWQQVTFRGIQQTLDLVPNPQNYDIVCVPYVNLYYCRITANGYTKLKYRGEFSSLEDVSFPENKDCVKVNKQYYRRTNSDWVPFKYNSNEYKLPDIKEAYNDTLYVLNTYRYFMYVDKWVETNVPIYMLNVEEIEG